MSLKVFQADLTSRNISDVGAGQAFLRHGGLSGLALWNRDDPEILPDYVGAEIDWRLKRLGMRNTAVGLGTTYDLKERGWSAASSIGLFF